MKHTMEKCKQRKTVSKSTLKNGKYQMPKFQAALKSRQENLKNSCNRVNSMLASPELP